MCRVPTVGASVARHNYKKILVEKRLLSYNRNSVTSENRNARHGYSSEIKYLTACPFIYAGIELELGHDARIECL